MSVADLTEPELLDELDMTARNIDTLRRQVTVLLEHRNALLREGHRRRLSTFELGACAQVHRSLVSHVSRAAA